MELEIRLFANLKDLAGQERIRVDVPEPVSVQSMLERVAENYPRLETALPSSLVAVNRAFAASHATISTGDEVAIFPPVSGGNDDLPYPTYFAISRDAPDITSISALLTQPEIGAIVSFTGSVRGQTQRKGLPSETQYLEYEAYTSMAESKMTQIAQEIWERWPLVRGVAIVQRIGRLDIGDMTTFIACASAHRDQGVFEAARYGIDRLKEIVPVWKKEVGADQTTWVEGHYRPTEKDN